MITENRPYARPSSWVPRQCVWSYMLARPLFSILERRILSLPFECRRLQLMVLVCEPMRYIVIALCSITLLTVDALLRYRRSSKSQVKLNHAEDAESKAEADRVTRQIDDPSSKSSGVQKS